MPITFEQYQQIYQKNLITEVQRQTLLGVRTALTDAAERAQNHIDQYGDKDERFSPKQQKAVNDLAQLFDKIDTLTSEPSKIKPEVWEQYVKSLEGAEKLIDSNDLMPGLKAIGVDPAPVFEGFRVLNETFGFEMPVDKWQQSYQAEKIAPEKAPQQHDNIIIEEPNLNVIKEEPKYENGALAGNIVDFCRKANRDEADKLKLPLLDVVAETAYISDGLTKKNDPALAQLTAVTGKFKGLYEVAEEPKSVEENKLRETAAALEQLSELLQYKKNLQAFAENIYEGNKGFCIEALNKLNKDFGFKFPVDKIQKVFDDPNAQIDDPKAPEPVFDIPAPEAPKQEEPKQNIGTLADNLVDLCRDPKAEENKTRWDNLRILQSEVMGVHEDMEDTKNPALAQLYLVTGKLSAMSDVCEDPKNVEENKIRDTAAALEQLSELLQYKKNVTAFAKGIN